MSIKIINRKVVFTTVAIFSSAIPVCASAQQASSATSYGPAALEEIIVTAQRRAESMQDVPIAVSAITGDYTIKAGFTGSESIQMWVPAMNVQRQANGAHFFMRGIGSSIGSANSESSVAVYVDGVYQPTMFAGFFDFNNIERIEVMKGPQGTLFGRNATGGVIQVVTKDPGDAPEGNVEVDYGNYDTVSTSAYISGPLTENLGANLAVIYSDQNKGFGDNLTTGEEINKSEDLAVRAKLVYTPSDATRIGLSLDYYDSENCGICAQNLEGTVNAVGQGYPGEFNTWGEYEPFSKVDGSGGSLRIEHDFGAVQFLSISAYREYDGHWTLDQEQSPLPIVQADIFQSSQMLTQELQILSPQDSKFQWVVGAYYYDYEAGHTPLRIAGLAFAPLPGVDFYNVSTTESVAGFFQGTYPIAENTNLTLGYRHTWDDIDMLPESTILGTSIPIDPASGITKSLSYDKPTWRVSLDHQLTEEVMVYVSYNRGVKSGNIDVGGSASTTAPYLPEQLDAYEIGLKSDLLDRRVRLNIAAFYYDFEDIQFQKIVSGAGVIFNGGSAEITGIEADLRAQVTENLAVSAGFGYLDTEIGDFPGAPITVRLPSGGTISGPADFNAEGNELPSAPEFSGYAGFEYTIPSSVGNFGVTAHLYHNNGMSAEIDNRVKFDSYTILNGSISWTAPDEHWNVRLWGKNLTDEYYYKQSSGQANALDIGGPADPRTYGVTVGYQF